jgi:hypothetical protein
MPSKTPKIEFWVLSPHAMARMNERRVTLVELSEIIESPDFRIPQGSNGFLEKKLRDAAIIQLLP